MAKSLFLTRPTLITHIATPEARLTRWNELNQWIADGDLEVRIGHTFPLTEAAAAHSTRGAFDHWQDPAPAVSDDGAMTTSSSPSSRRSARAVR